MSKITELYFGKNQVRDLAGEVIEETEERGSRGIWDICPDAYGIPGRNEDEIEQGCSGAKEPKIFNSLCSRGNPHYQECELYKSRRQN